MFIPPRQYNADGFVIRAYRADDAAELARSINASHEHLAPWMPWSKPDTTTEESQIVIEGMERRFSALEDFTLGVWDSDTLIGGTGYHLRWGPRDWGVAEVGMWIAADRTSQGLGTRVLAALVDWGFTDWGWHRLVWRCDEENVASARVAEKMGFRREGVLRGDRINVAGDRVNTLVYGLVRSDVR